MPGPVSDSSKGPSADSPYVPSWCYDAPGPRMCRCGDHEGYHNDAGECLRRARCECSGFAERQNIPKPGMAVELEGFHLLCIIPGDPDHRCHDCIRELDDSLKCGICGARYEEVSS